MRPCTIPILAAIADSIALSAPAHAGSKVGPGASKNYDWAGPVFWPGAADDLLDYAFFPKGKDERFWTIGFGVILSNAFLSPAADDPRARRSLELSNRDSDTVRPAKAPDLAANADRCRTDRAVDSANQLIARIEQAIRPSAPQQEILEQLRSAVAQAADRINTACPAAAPATAMERINAIQARIWAMRDGLLTVRLPFERLYDSLSGDQDWRLAGASDPREATARTETAGRRSQMCSEQGSDIADWPMRAIGRALQPTEQQRASLEALQMRLAAMAQLIAGSCPTYPLIGPMGRIAAASDRLDVMLFAVMTMSPALPDFYDSLAAKQKVGLHRVIRQFQRSAQLATDF
jgi:hypothetical protein